jgi:hypothetical protein
VKKLFVLLTGVGLGFGLAVVLFGIGLPGFGEGESATSEAKSPVGSRGQPEPGTEAVKVNGRMIRTRENPESGSEASEPQTVEVDGRRVWTQGEPEKDAKRVGKPSGAETEEFEEMRRDYREKTDEYEKQLPMDPETAEKLLEAIDEGAEKFGGSTVPQGEMAPNPKSENREQ